MVAFRSGFPRSYAMEQPAGKPADFAGKEAEVDGLRLEELRATLSHQIVSLAQLGTRTTNLLSILVGTIAAAIAVERATTPSLPIWVLVPIVVVVALVVLAIVLASQVLLSSSRVDIGEDPESLAKHRSDDPAALRGWLIQEYSEMIVTNRAAMRERAEAFERVMILLLTAAALLIAASTVLYGTTAIGG
jgi:hypothetical protein